VMRNKAKRSRSPSASKKPAPTDPAARMLMLATQQFAVQTLSPDDSRALAVEAGYLTCLNAARLGPFPGMPDGDAALYFLPQDKLLLIYYSDHPIDASVVRRVCRCCRWIETHPAEVWGSIRDKTQLGPIPLNRAALFVKLVAPGFAERIQERLISIGVPTAAIEFSVGRSESRECLIYRVHESAPVGSPGNQTHVSQAPDATLERNDPYAIGPLLFAIRCVVDGVGAKASRQGPSVAAETFVRLYGLLVVLAARLAISTTPPAADPHGKPAVDKDAAQRLNVTLELLGRLLRTASTQKQAFARGGARIRLSRSLHTDLRRLSKDADEFSAGPLSLNWQTSVPVTFKSFIDEMIFPETSSAQRDRDPDGSLARVFQLPIGTVETIGGVVAITQCCDVLSSTVVGRRAEMQPTTADLVRVACSHRLLAELVALTNRNIAVAVLSDAAAMAEIMSGLGGQPGRPRDLATSVAIAKHSCRSSINSIKRTGRLTREGKTGSGTLDIAMTQERELARFFQKVL
jgi:hypothetical protein